MSDEKISAAIVRLSDLFESGRLQASLAPAEFIHRVADEIISVRAQRDAAVLTSERNAARMQELEQENAAGVAWNTAVPVADILRMARYGDGISSRLRHWLAANRYWGVEPEATSANGFLSGVPGNTEG